MLEQLHERHLVGVEGVREVWLVRHADAYTGLEELGPGLLDPPLSPVGREQAARLAMRLAYLPIDQVWSSDLRRAVETAEAVARPHSLEVGTDARLREVLTAWDEGGRSELGQPGEYPFPESEQDVFARVEGAVKDVVAGLADGGRGVCVGHKAPHGILVV